ncbi:DUF1028 domain-containing protein [Rhodovarius crocodyli]|uniref:DUF1028 domain-containing protein n=1 Tax=Rhodovarius crocodyli TaxID=1979269 RepID=A0A437MJJ8_9PROT|nr:DUF1028 domain-containing protein [Rhodovarius crocodyli]RVT97811.1 DUF1028 domain-containing protein [Rhodovarius crocodyli]
MTFSLIARCARTGQLGIATTTSGIAVGSRVPWAAAHVGAVATQHRTDPRLGARGVELLRSGCTAEETVAALAASTPDHQWRQIGVVDAEGRTAFFHGARVKPRSGAVQGQGVLALGNILANDDVLPAMVAGFDAASDAPLAERLIRGLEAGEAAGGEHGAIQSAALYVVAEESFPYVDLRVDRGAAPLEELRALWKVYLPELDLYVRRAVDPESMGA